MSRYDDYTLDHLSLGERKIPPFDDYEPQPPFDVDSRPIDGNDLREWRRSTRRAHRDSPRQARHLPIHAVAAVIGRSPAIWTQWEGNGMPGGGWAALFRAWTHGEVDEIPNGSEATVGQLKALACLSDYDTLAELFHRSADTVRDWPSRGIPKRGGVGALVVWLFEDMALEGSSYVPKGDVIEADVRRWRRRYRSGEFVSQIADDEGRSKSTVHGCVFGDSWSHLQDPPPCTPHTRHRKLTPEMVAEARRSVRAGSTVTEVWESLDFDGCRATVKKAVLGTTWSRIEDPPPVSTKEVPH